jgi:hypothetical protein
MTADARRVAPTPAAPAAGRFPVTVKQERHLRRNGEGVAFGMENPYIALRLSGSLDVAALQTACGALVRRHDALRTRFAWTGAGFEQWTAPTAPGALELVADADGRPPSCEDVARRLLFERVHTPLDLARGPVVRGSLVRLSGDVALLALAFSHAICDGWSLELALRELGAHYAAARGGRPLAPLAAPSWRAWAESERPYVEGAAGRADMEFWRRELAGTWPAPEVVLPAAVLADCEAPPGRPHAVRRVFGDAEAARLERFAARHRVTPFMVAVAAVKRRLAELTEDSDVLVAAPFAGRDVAATHGLVGCLANVVVLRSAVARGAPLGATAATVRDTVLRVYGHQRLPFSLIVDELAPQLNARPPRPPWVFVYYEDDRALLGAFEGLDSELVELEPLDRWTQPAICFFWNRRPDGLALELRHQTHVLPPACAEALVAAIAEDVAEALDPAHASNASVAARTAVSAS